MDTAVTAVTDNVIGKNKGIHINEIIKLADRGLTPTEIGRLLGCNHSNVIRRLQAVGYDRQAVNDYKALRADIFANGQRRIVSAITDKDLKNASLLQKATAVGILYDKERLERGKVGNDPSDSISSMVEVVDKLIKLAKGGDPAPVPADEPIDVTPHPSEQD